MRTRMDKLKKRIDDALKVLDPINEKATLQERIDAFLVLKETINLLYE
jgi:hypothetical protein